MTTPYRLDRHQDEEAGGSAWQQALFRIVYRDDTRAGRIFDLVLIVAILFSVAVIMLDTVEDYSRTYATLFHVAEWTITVLFTIEYGARLSCVRHPLRYATSFYGVIDLMSILPTYLSLFITGSEYLLVIRILRLLRIFRILNLLRYVQSGNLLLHALYASRQKIIVFFLSVFALVVIFGSVVYVIEGPANGFTSIPRSIYWAVVTVTTTGYGDITPKTPLGQGLAALVMLTGYAIIAVPTGIFTAELASSLRRQVNNRQCGACGQFGHEIDARFCHHCGKRLED